MSDRMEAFSETVERIRREERERIISILVGEGVLNVEQNYGRQLLALINGEKL